MDKKQKEEISKFIDVFVEKNPWIMNRTWDDDCICPNENTVDPRCHNKRCKRLAKK